MLTRPAPSCTQPTTRKRSDLAPSGMFNGRNSLKLRRSEINSASRIFHEGWNTFLTKFRGTGEPSKPAGSVSTSTSQACNGAFAA